jgi:hypothetical protein
MREWTQPRRGGWSFGGFSLLKPTNMAKRIVVASWHNPRSATWRWALYLSWGEKIFDRRRYGIYRLSCPRGFALVFGYIEIDLKIQRSLWLRDVNQSELGS